RFFKPSGDEVGTDWKSVLPLGGLMQTESVNWSRMADTLESLRQELARLGERVAVLEMAIAPASRGDEARHSSGEEPLSEEIILVIAAAVAAFLGKKALIRQIRLLGSAAWAQQGRVTIQASHTLEAHTGRR